MCIAYLEDFLFPEFLRWIHNWVITCIDQMNRRDKIRTVVMTSSTNWRPTSITVPIIVARCPRKCPRERIVEIKESPTQDHDVINVLREERTELLNHPSRKEQTYQYETNDRCTESNSFRQWTNELPNCDSTILKVSKEVKDVEEWIKEKEEMNINTEGVMF